MAMALLKPRAGVISPEVLEWPAGVIHALARIIFLRLGDEDMVLHKIPSAPTALNAYNVLWNLAKQAVAALLRSCPVEDRLVPGVTDQAGSILPGVDNAAPSTAVWLAGFHLDQENEWRVRRSN